MVFNVNRKLNNLDIVYELGPLRMKEQVYNSIMEYKKNNRRRQQ